MKFFTGSACTHLRLIFLRDRKLSSHAVALTRNLRSNPRSRLFFLLASSFLSHTSIRPEITMKFIATAFLLASSALSASAFSAVSPPSNGIKSDPVDKTLRGIDAEGSFDPTDGENAALSRNNNDEVWNQQVSLNEVSSCLSTPLHS